MKSKVFSNGLQGQFQKYNLYRQDLLTFSSIIFRLVPRRPFCSSNGYYSIFKQANMLDITDNHCFWYKKRNSENPILCLAKHVQCIRFSIVISLYLHLKWLHYSMLSSTDLTNFVCCIRMSNICSASEILFLIKIPLLSSLWHDMTCDTIDSQT